MSFDFESWKNFILSAATSHLATGNVPTRTDFFASDVLTVDDFDQMMREIEADLVAAKRKTDDRGV